jgi:CHAD domain-containing protein
MQCHYLLPDPSQLEALVAALAQVDRAQREAPQQLTRTVLDTFDCRLQAADVVLEANVPKSGDVELGLRPRHGERAEHWTAGSAPRAARDVEHARLRARLAELTAGRALLPRVSTRIERHRVHWVDALGKRIATLEVEYCRPSRGVAALALLRVRPVQGFERACQRLMTSVRRSGLVTPTTADSAEVLIGARGRPAVYQAKPIVELAPDTASVRALGALFGAYGNVMWANEPGIIDDLDIEFLHDYRVALRSIRSWLLDLRRVVTKPVRAHFRAELAALNRLTGRLRDLDVLQENLPHYLQALGGVDPEYAQALAALVHAERAPTMRAVAQHLRGRRYHAFRRSWRKLARDLVEGKRGGEWGERELKKVVRHALRRRLERVVEFPWSRARDEPAVLHELRKECKKLRYLLEGFQRLFDESCCRRAIGELKTVQTAMGDTWDLHVHHEILRELAGSLPGDSPVARGVLPIVIALETRLTALEHAHCELVTIAFERFRSTAVQRIYTRLLEER